MSLLAAFGKLASKDSLGKLASFHNDLVLFVSQGTSGDSDDHYDFLESATKYLDFLRDLGVLDIPAPSEPRESTDADSGGTSYL